MDKEFFDSRLLYYGLDHFYANRYEIREVLHEQDSRTVHLYQWYVYSRPFINDTWKDYIWDFLYNDIEDYRFAELYIEYKKRHGLI